MKEVAKCVQQEFYIHKVRSNFQYLKIKNFGPEVIYFCSKKPILLNGTYNRNLTNRQYPDKSKAVPSYYSANVR